MECSICAPILVDPQRKQFCLGKCSLSVLISWCVWLWLWPPCRMDEFRLNELADYAIWKHTMNLSQLESICLQPTFLPSARPRHISPSSAFISNGEITIIFKYVCLKYQQTHRIAHTTRPSTAKEFGCCFMSMSNATCRPGPEPFQMFMYRINADDDTRPMKIHTAYKISLF